MHTQLGGSRVGLPSNPSSRKGSILDIAQQQQQQQQFQQQTQQQLQQYQQQQQQHHPQFQQQYQQQQQHPQQQHHQQQYQQQQHQKQQKHQLPQLPVGIGNAATSPPSDEENQQFTTRWKGSATNLRPQNTKQALSALKQASSATNVAMQGQSGSTSGSLLSVGGTDSPKQMRKGSMINLKTATGNSENTLGAPAALQRKGSVYAHTTTERGTVGSGSLQRKGSVYPGSGGGGGGGGWTIGGDTESPTIRKGSMFNLSITDSPTMQRKPSMASHNASTKSLSHGNNSDSLSSLTSTTVTTIATIGIDTDYGLKMGPGQIHPKGYRLTTVRHGELKMGFAKIKGVVEVEVICARNIVPVDCETPPDTYVKCYVRDGDRLRHKKKTRVVRHSAEPFYKQTLKYQSADVFGRNIVIMVWQRCVGFEHNQGLGGTEVNLDKINASQRIGGWYPLFPMHSLGGSDSDNSP